MKTLTISRGTDLLGHWPISGHVDEAYLEQEFSNLPIQQNIRVALKELAVYAALVAPELSSPAAIVEVAGHQFVLDLVERKQQR